MANRGGYLGGSTIVRVSPKRSKISKIKQNKKRKYDAQLAAEYAAYKTELELPVQSISASRAAPSREGKKKSNRILKELEPLINQLRQLACDYTKITGEPSCLVHDLAIYKVQSMENIIGVRRGLAGFDGWRMKKRVVAVGVMLQQSSKDVMATPMTINGLDQEWDKLYFVFFNDMYHIHSIYSLAKDELCDVIGEFGWKDDNPAFVLPLSVVVKLSDHIYGHRLEPKEKIIIEGGPAGGKKRSRYFRTT